MIWDHLTSSTQSKTGYGPWENKSSPTSLNGYLANKTENITLDVIGGIVQNDGKKKRRWDHSWTSGCFWGLGQLAEAQLQGSCCHPERLSFQVLKPSIWEVNSLSHTQMWIWYRQWDLSYDLLNLVNLVHLSMIFMYMIPSCHSALLPTRAYQWNDAGIFGSIFPFDFSCILGHRAWPSQQLFAFFNDPRSAGRRIFSSGAARQHCEHQFLGIWKTQKNCQRTGNQQHGFYPWFIPTPMDFQEVLALWWCFFGIWNCPGGDLIVLNNKRCAHRWPSHAKLRLVQGTRGEM